MKILLVHGAAHDEQCWIELIPFLEDKGFDVHCLTLRGHGDHSMNAFRVNMKGYSDDVCAKAEAIGGRVTLLGHSMAGLVISSAAEARPDLFSHVIYLTAFVPHLKNRRLVTLSKKINNPLIDSALNLHLLTGTLSFDRSLACELFYNCFKGDVGKLVERNLCQQPIRPWLSSVRWSQSKLGSVPKSYIECTIDNAIPIVAQRDMQRNMEFARIISLPSDHSPFSSMPSVLAESIFSLVC